MAKIFGIRPAAETRQLIEKFEDEVLVRHNNQSLLGSVYVDMQENRWAVAFAYNFSRKPGLHGHENVLEVRYSVKPEETGGVRMFRSDEMTERVIPNGSFADQDVFVRFALTQERARAGRTA